MDVEMKKGQITLFILIALMIVVVFLLLFFYLRQRTIQIQEQLNPVNYVEQCTKDAVDKAVNLMLPQGGYVNPENYILYNNNKVAYLCYNTNYYQACINQEPVYLVHLEQEITNFIQPKIEECFYLLQQELEKRNYKVDSGNLKIDTKVIPDRIEVIIDKRFETTKNNDVKSYDQFKTRKTSPLFELANVAREIVNQEAKYCNFEYVGYMLSYPRFDLTKQSIGQAKTASKVYVIGDRSTGKKLYIAIRSCEIPPGF